MNHTRCQSIITTRHSVTAHNTARIITGRLDEPLSAEGRAYAEQFASAHGVIAVDVVVSSPARRAVETAALITDRPASEIMRSHLCLERDYGLLQGLDSDQVQRYQNTVRYLHAGGIAHSLNPPGGETFEQVRRRAHRFYKSIRQLPIESVLIVSHQIFLQQLHGIVLSLNWRQSLALDIRPLQIDRFTMIGSSHIVGELIHPGVGTVTSW